MKCSICQKPLVCKEHGTLGMVTNEPTYDDLLIELKNALNLLWDWLPDDQDEFREEYDRAEDIERTVKRAEGII